jgi:hypothetical protein
MSHNEFTIGEPMEPQEVVRAYDGRYQIEVNIDEVKELGLAHYQGRSGRGIRRWPLFLSLGQMILKFIATGVGPRQTFVQNFR